MQEQQTQPLILTLQFDEASQQFFDHQRKLYFPQERNYLTAHLSLFHQLPPNQETVRYLEAIQYSQFEMEVTKLIKLGGGVAYFLESQELTALHQQLTSHFKNELIPQDLQPYRPHITIQNKVAPSTAALLFNDLSKDFSPFKVRAEGLKLWTYLGGPWQHERTFLFSSLV
jgi:2'-5' RNA ligase